MSLSKKNAIPEHLYKTRQSYPLWMKVEMTKNRIRAWYDKWNGSVFCSFSGGKDSLVLLHIARSIYPEMKGAFVDTGLEYPEIRDFVKTIPNIDWLKPKMNFREVLDKYGYPVISKDQATALSRYANTKDLVQKYRRLNGWPNGKKGMISKKWQHLIHAPFKISAACCRVMKKNPLDAYAKERRYEFPDGRKPMAAVMGADSHNRKFQFKKYGCLPFSAKKPISWPMGFWTDKDVWKYIKENEIAYSKIYDMGEDRTGCMFCAFGAHKNTPNRFQRMALTHPKQYKYCMDTLGMSTVLAILGVDYHPVRVK